MTGRRRKRLAWATAAVLGVSGVAATRHCTRPACCPGLPGYDYQFGTVAPPVVTVSLPEVTVEGRPPFTPGVPPDGLTIVPAPVVRGRVKYFQLGQARIENNHCFLSQVAVTLHESGAWTLSLRADQNPWMTGPRHEVSTPVQLRGAVSALQPPIPPLVLETNSLKRNLFMVKVRCYGAYRLREAVPTATTGKPVLFELPPAIFWVQRGVPYDFWNQQPLPAVSQNFDLIDRVEIEFSYH